MHTRYFQVGGVIEDIPAGWVEKVREFIDDDARRAPTSTATCSNKNEIVLQRLRGVCPLRRADAARRSASPARCCARPATRGTCARRCPTAPTRTSTSRSRSAPWATTTTATRCAWPRSTSRCKIIEQALDGLPEGPFITDDRKVALPPRHELATSMEALIHHFKLVTEGFRVPPGEVYYPIESPRGELGCFVRSDGSSQAGARAHARPELREPAGARADGRGRLHRRPDRDAGDARPDPRRHRPVSIDPSSVAATPTARASPAGTTPSTSTRTRRSSPTRRRRRCRRAARRDRGRMAKYPDRRSRRRSRR